MTRYRTLPPYKLAGFNLCPQPPEISAADAWVAWWGNWQSKPTRDEAFAQVDLAKSAGANCVRCIGSTRVVTSGTLTRTQYLANVAQLVSYCHGKGIWVYGTADSALNFDTNASQSSLAAEVAAYCRALAGFPNVAGCDLFQECNSYTGSPSSLFQAYAAAARGAAPGLAIAASFVASASFRDAGYEANILPYVDFADFHIYFNPSGASALDSFRAAFPATPVVIGEFGADAHAGDRTSGMTARVAVVNRADVTGGLVWSVQNMLAGENYYGAWLGDGTPQADVLGPAATTPRAPGYFGPRRRRGAY